VIEFPFVSLRAIVQQEWTDANRHLNSVRYLEVFRDGFAALFQALDVGRSPSGTLFQGQVQVRYECELVAGDPLVIRSWLVAADAKRLHHVHEMLHEDRGVRAATAEYIHLHIDTATRRVGPMPSDAQARVQSVLSASRRRPDGGYGRALALTPRISSSSHRDRGHG